MDEQLRAALREHLDGDVDRVDHLVDAWIGDGDVIARTLAFASLMSGTGDISTIKVFKAQTHTGRFYDQRGQNVAMCDSESPLCSRPGCLSAARTVGLCVRHYGRKRAGIPMDKTNNADRTTGFRNPNARIPQDTQAKRRPKVEKPRTWPTTCSFPDCDRRQLATGLCSAHYQRRRNGIDTNDPIRAWVPKR